jgi:hypothetical protein
MYQGMRFQSVSVARHKILYIPIWHGTRWGGLPSRGLRPRWLRGGTRGSMAPYPEIQNLSKVRGCTFSISDAGAFIH